MMTIWKYPFRVSDSVAIEMPTGARILPFVGATSHTDVIVAWAEVDPDQPEETRVLHVVGTGHPMPTRSVTYVGTALAGPFVWHVYEPAEVTD